MLHRTKEALRSGTLIVAGDQWPVFLYKEYSVDRDDVWKGLFMSDLLVFVESSDI